MIASIAIVFFILVVSSFVCVVVSKVIHPTSVSRPVTFVATIWLVVVWPGRSVLVVAVVLLTGGSDEVVKLIVSCIHNSIDSR